MKREARAALLPLVALGVAAPFALAACKKSEPASVTMSSAVDSASAAASLAPPPRASAVAESLPRCRAEGARAPISGDEVVVGDAVVTSDAIVLGVVRRDGARRIASVLRASLDLASMRAIDLGPSRGDDPPPALRMRGTSTYVATYARAKAADAGASSDVGERLTRVLEVSRIETGAAPGDVRPTRVGSVVQQADESLAFDVAWRTDGGEGAPALVAWDEDAPARPGELRADRGVVKVQLLESGAKARVVSPEASDAEAPRLLARPGGYWLAWLARRPEAVDDAGALEGPGERRAYRWVEAVALDAKGEATSTPRRVSPQTGRVASFDLAAGDDAQLVVLAQDEAAYAEGAGERIVRYVVERDAVDVADVLDGGVGHALAELLPAAPDAATPRWLAFTDTQERAHLLPLGVRLRVFGANTIEPALDGARVVGAAQPDLLYAVSASAGSRTELRRLVCR